MVEAVRHRARCQAAMRFRVVVERTQVPFRPVMADVLGARGACGVGDSECTLGSELKFGDALGHVAAAVHAVNTVAQWRAPRTGPR